MIKGTVHRWPALPSRLRPPGHAIRCLNTKFVHCFKVFLLQCHDTNDCHCCAEFGELFATSLCDRQNRFCCCGHYVSNGAVAIQNLRISMHVPMFRDRAMTAATTNSLVCDCVGNNMHAQLAAQQTASCSDRGEARDWDKSLQILWDLEQTSSPPQSSAVTGSGRQIDDDVTARVLKPSRAPSRISNWLTPSTRRGDYLEASPPCKRKS